MKIHRGITLIELLVVLFLTTGFLSVAATFFVETKEHSQWTAQQSSLYRTSIRLSEQFRSDCALAIDATAYDSNHIVVSLDDQTTIDYQATDNVLVRRTLKEKQTLATETYTLAPETQFTFTLVSNPRRVLCQAVQQLPGVENKARLETSIEAVVGSRLLATPRRERAAE